MSNQLSANVDLRKKLELNSNLQAINGEKKTKLFSASILFHWMINKLISLI